MSGCNYTSKENIHVSENDLSQATTTFKELKVTLEKDDGSLWNHKLDGPILLINRVTRIIIANENDKQGSFQKNNNLYFGTFPENLNIGNGIQEWNGKLWVAVGLPLSEIREERMRLMIHESFHRIQPEIGFDSLTEDNNTHLDTKEGRILLKLELEALKKATQSNQPEEHIKNALLIRIYRHQVFPGSSDSENSLEINEGIAEYTGTILCGMNDSDLLKQYRNRIDQVYAMPTLVRAFPYCTIPVYGYFMEKKNKSWNLKIIKNTNLTTYISNFFNVNNQSINQNEIALIGKSYYIDSIKIFEENRQYKQSIQINEYKKQFYGDSVLSIPLEGVEVTYNMKNFVPLDTSGTVYQNLRITDDWGILEVDSCGVFVSSDWKSVIITYPKIISDSLISGKGWKLKLNDYWRLINEGKKLKLTKLKN